MSQNEFPVSDVADTAAPDDAEVAAVLDAYLAAIEAGRAADPERLLAEHPAIAEQLRDCLRVMNLAERMVDASESELSSRRSIPRLDSTMSHPGQSVLTTLGPGVRPPPHAQLRDLLDESEPLIDPRSAEMPVQDGATVGRFQLQG
jgi:hypothetical protein